MYHLTWARMAIKKSTDNKSWRVHREKGNVLQLCWWECNLVQPEWKTVWRFLRKLKRELPYDPATPLLGIYPEEKRHYFQMIRSDQLLSRVRLFETP